MGKKCIYAKEFWNRLISVRENDWVGFDTIDEVLSEMPSIDYEIINDAHNEGYDVGYWAGRRDFEPKWIPVTERLPEENKEVLTSDSVFGITFDSIYNGKWIKHPIAWMPLPEPYKGGDEE